MKEIKLREINLWKSCIECKKNVKIVMEGLNGHCPECKARLFTLETRQRNGRER